MKVSLLAGWLCCRYLLTCSRDQSVKLWQMTAQGPSLRPWLTLPPFAAAVTAVATARWPSGASAWALIAVGLESGAIEVWRCLEAGEQPCVEQVWRSDDQQRHAGAVRRLAWQDGVGSGQLGTTGPLLLASCGDDHAVRVLSIADD
jgi:hypothetical protein